MKITVFTSNQPRHLSLIADLAAISDEVYAIQECNTVFPGEVDDFFKKSETMQTYFSKVIAAEQEVFGDVDFSPSNVRSLSVKGGDLNGLKASILEPALDSDLYVVFGASYIRGDLADFLVSKRSLNIHMGISPYYRGSSCNFWAQYDGSPNLVGATIHILSKGLDSGEMLYHALPKPGPIEPFELGMRAVRAAHQSLKGHIVSGAIHQMDPVRQSREQEIRYTRNSEFDDAVAKEFLDRQVGAADIERSLSVPTTVELLRPEYL